MKLTPLLGGKFPPHVSSFATLFHAKDRLWIPHVTDALVSDFGAQWCAQWWGNGWFSWVHTEEDWKHDSAMQIQMDLCLKDVHGTSIYHKFCFSISLGFKFHLGLPKTLNWKWIKHLFSSLGMNYCCPMTLQLCGGMSTSVRCCGKATSPSNLPWCFDSSPQQVNYSCMISDDPTFCLV